MNLQNSGSSIFSNRIFVTTTFGVVNAFTWYLIAWGILVQTIEKNLMISTTEIAVIWTVHFVAVIAAFFIGATISSRLENQETFSALWITSGILVSLLPLVLDPNFGNIVVQALLWAIVFGFGMPSQMASYSELTNTDNRGKLGGIVYFAINIGLVFFGILFPQLGSIRSQTLVLAIWRGVGLTSFLLFQNKEKQGKIRKNPSYKTIFSKNFTYYFFPWIMFSLVNSLMGPTLPDNIIANISLVTFTMAGISTLGAGILSDRIGRKPVVISGLLMLMISYALLGMFPGDFSYSLYAVVDGVAWGMFGVIFVIVLWGDFSENKMGQKYYAIGALPYLLSIFLEILVAPYIEILIPLRSTIFSFASFFLFLSILPLIYAKETLPEKKIKERELQQYIKKAQEMKRRKE